MYRNLEKVRNLCNFLLFYLFMLLVTKWIRLKEHVQEYRIDVNHQLKPELKNKVLHFFEAFSNLWSFFWSFFAILILRCHFLTLIEDNCRRRKKLSRCWKYSWSWNIQNISISSITRRCKGRARYYLIFISYIFIKSTEQTWIDKNQH